MRHTERKREGVPNTHTTQMHTHRHTHTRLPPAPVCDDEDHDVDDDFYYCNKHACSAFSRARACVRISSTRGGLEQDGEEEVVLFGVVVVSLCSFFPGTCLRQILSSVVKDELIRLCCTIEFALISLLLVCWK